jgi:hypothetical protein
MRSSEPFRAELRAAAEVIRSAIRMSPEDFKALMYRSLPQLYATASYK